MGVGVGVGVGLGVGVGVTLMGGGVEPTPPPAPPQALSPKASAIAQPLDASKFFRINPTPLKPLKINGFPECR